MLPSKTKSGLFETPNNKTTPATPRVSKASRSTSRSEADSHSPLNSRHSIDRSPKSVDSKPKVERRSLMTSTTPDKQARAAKNAELQVQLNVAQEDLRKAKERMVLLEKEKGQALEELNEAKKQSEEANQNLKEALVTLKKAEESTEIEKFRTIELEQAGIEAAQQREEMWQKELETVQNQHELDVSAFLSKTQELQRVKQELAMTTEAKNTALSHADDAMKIAEINAEKVELLSGEITRLKKLIDSKVETETNNAFEQLKKSDSEINALKLELEKAKEAENKLTEMENLMEGLKVKITDAKREETDAINLVEEWKKKAKQLEEKVEETLQSERASSESLAVTVKELEQRNASLQDSVSEIACLKGKVEFLELEITKHKDELKESDRRLDMAKEEALEMEKTIEILKSEIQSIEDEKAQALDNEKKLSADHQNLLEEKNKFVIELENSRDEVEQTKKAMDGLASALHEVSSEARESKERLLTKQAEVEDAKVQIDDLNLVIRSTEEKYIAMLSEAKDENVRLEVDIESIEMESENSRTEWIRKELSFVNSLKKSEEEVEGIKKEMDEMVVKLKYAEVQAVAAKEEATKLQSRIEEAKKEAAVASEAAEEAKTITMKLKETLLDKENELQSITQENDELRTREEAALEKIKELSELLKEATTKREEENSKLMNGQNNSIEVPNTIEIPVDIAIDSEEHKHELDDGQSPRVNRILHEEDTHLKESNGTENKFDEPLEVDSQKVVDCVVVDKGVSPKREPELDSVEDETDSRVDNDSPYQVDHLSALESAKNGGSPPSKKKQQKKKAILSKFGSLLMKRGSQK